MWGFGGVETRWLHSGHHGPTQSRCLEKAREMKDGELVVEAVDL